MYVGVVVLCDCILVDVRRSELGRDYLEAPLHKMWEQINYCNFLLKAQVGRHLCYVTCLFATFHCCRII